MHISGSKNGFVRRLGLISCLALIGSVGVVDIYQHLFAGFSPGLVPQPLVGLGYLYSGCM